MVLFFLIISYMVLFFLIISSLWIALHLSVYVGSSVHLSNEHCNWKVSGDRHGRYHMVVGFITTYMYAISAYHH